MRWDADVPALALRGDVRRAALDGDVPRLSLRMGTREDVVIPPEPEPDFFYGISGGIARYDARTLGLADGAPVASWGDASGQVGDAVCVDPGRCPLYSAALPGLRFDLTGRYLHLPAELSFSIPAEWSVIVLVERLARNPYQNAITLGQTAATLEWSLAMASLNRAGTFYGGAAGTSDGETWPNGTGIASRVADGSEARVYIDDDLVLTRAAGTTEAEPDARPAIGGLISSAGAVANPLNAIVHDLLFFDRALSPSELASVRAAMVADWGI